MKDEDKTRDELINELVEVRQRITKLETSKIERKKTERRTRKEKEFASNLLRRLKEGFAVVDQERKQILANDELCKMTGYSEKELINQKPPFKYWAEEGLKDINEAFEKTLKGVEGEYELIFKRKDGEKFIALVSHRNIIDADGNTIFFATVKDLTERKKAEQRIKEYAEELRIRNLQLKVETEKAKEADRLKTEFLANTSHEVRTPLTAIKGAAYLLDESSLSKKQKKFCSIIMQSGEQLLTIINNILDLARIEAGELKLEKKEFSLKETLEKITPGFKLEAEKKGVSLQLFLSSDLPLTMRADEGKITQILFNLLSNALKFTDRGKVELRVKRLADSKIQILVEDTGIGIPQEKLSLIFNKFYQADGTMTRKYRGTGLGLTIVKELVAAMKGKIEVESRLGKGSTFSFSFPYEMAKWEIIGNQKQVKTQLKTKEKVRKDINILIAEDDDFGYYIIEEFLPGYTISRAVDGKDALEKIKKKNYDLVLMDVGMPKMDGLTATRKIREKDSHLPIIALTAKAMKADKEACLEAGCNDYISKPIVLDELMAKVNQYIAKRLVRKREGFPAQVLDIEALLKNSGEDKNLVQKTLKIFLEYLPHQLAKIKRSITDKNPEELKRTSHGLKAAAKTTGAKLIAGLASRLEKMAGLSSLNQAEDTFSRLEKEKARFQEAAKKIAII